MVTKIATYWKIYFRKTKTGPIIGEWVGPPFLQGETHFIFRDLIYTAGQEHVYYMFGWVH